MNFYSLSHSICGTSLGLAYQTNTPHISTQNRQTSVVTCGCWLPYLTTLAYGILIFCLYIANIHIFFLYYCGLSGLCTWRECLSFLSFYATVKANIVYFYSMFTKTRCCVCVSNSQLSFFQFLFWVVSVLGKWLLGDKCRTATWMKNTRPAESKFKLPKDCKLEGYRGAWSQFAPLHFGLEHSSISDSSDQINFSKSPLLCYPPWCVTCCHRTSRSIWSESLCSEMVENQFRGNKKQPPLLPYSEQPHSVLWKGSYLSTSENFAA
jgi:hypothetical protein